MLSRLNRDDQAIIYQCLLAVRNGPFLSEAELHTRIGLDPQIYDQILARWPAQGDEHQVDVETLISNVLNEVCNGLHITEQDWLRWFSADRESVKATYGRWTNASS